MDTETTHAAATLMVEVCGLIVIAGCGAVALIQARHRARRAEPVAESLPQIAARMEADARERLTVSRDEWRAAVRSWGEAARLVAEVTGDELAASRVEHVERQLVQGWPEPSDVARVQQISEALRERASLFADPA